jgi:AcrR family transcriptional regulator
MSTPRDDIEQAILQHARDFPDHGQARVAQEMAARGLRISASGVRYIWQAHDLETAYKRLKALQASSGDDSLSESQRALLRRGTLTRRLARGTRLQRAPGVVVEPDDRRQLILDTAARLFGERGYDGASVRDIAEQVGLLPGSIYHHFSSKDDLFVEVHKEGFRQLSDTVEQALSSESDPWARLEIACASHIRALVEGNSISTVTGFSLFSLKEPRLKIRLQRDRDRYETIFVGLVAALDLPGTIDRTLLRMFLFGALNWTLVWFRPGKKSPQNIARQLVTLVRGG